MSETSFAKSRIAFRPVKYGVFETQRNSTSPWRCDVQSLRTDPIAALPADRAVIKSIVRAKFSLV